MRANVICLFVTLSLCGLAMGCGDDGAGTVRVGDGLDGGDVDSSTGSDELTDSGSIILGGCDASDAKCVTDPNHMNHHDGDGGSDDGGSGDAG